jgi:hypothetical protein
MLLYANMAIDSIQNAKITFLKQTVQEESLQKPLVDFVEAQRVFTKQIAKSANDVMNIASKTFANAITGTTKKGS